MLAKGLEMLRSCAKLQHVAAKMTSRPRLPLCRAAPKRLHLHVIA